MPDDMETISLGAVQTIVREAYSQHAKVRTRARVRRQLIIRDADVILENLTGTYLPPPFDKTTLALKTMIGETAKAAQHYASRIAANTPKVSVTPKIAKSKLSVTLDRTSGEQERLDDQLWEENGGRLAQWFAGMNMTVTAANYYITGVRDEDFGLPDREYYEDEDEELEVLKRDGKLTPMKVPHPKTGKWQYAEHADVWRRRREEAREHQAQSGRALFTLEAMPRDQVAVGKDKDGIKWAVAWEEVPGFSCAGETDSKIAQQYARQQGVNEDDVGLWGIWTDKQGRIVGGIERGGPTDSTWTRPETFTLIRFWNRIEHVVLISSSASVEGAAVVYRGKHGAKRQGVPVCPVVEVAMMHTGINVAGQEFTTPMEPVFAYAPIINQILVLLSNAAAYNGTPRWAIELKDGTTLRGEDGEPVVVENGPVPGLDPSEAAAYPGTLKQLTIEIDSLMNLLSVYMERLDNCMPAPVTFGQSGSSAAAWQVRQLTQQAQENLRQPVDNHAAAVKEIIQIWHGWMRQLDMPVYFFASRDGKRGERSAASLIEFDPKNLTDSIQVKQELDTPEEQTVRIQTGLELRSQGAITWREFFEDYLQVQDAREAEIDMYAEQVVQQVIYGTQFPPGSLLDQLAKGMQGELHYMLIQQSDNYAISVAEQMAQQAQVQEQTGIAPTPGAGPGAPDGSQGVMEAAGAKVPGMGLSDTVQGQIGAGAPSPAPVGPVAA